MNAGTDFEVPVTLSFLDGLMRERDTAKEDARCSAIEALRCRRAANVATVMAALMTATAIAFAGLWWFA